MLTHYVFVRRDLPLGVMSAMLVHAAGESAHLYADENGRFRGATAVVLEAKNEDHLDTIAGMLYDHDIQHVEVWESGGLYAGQLMAIGLVPVERDKVANTLKEFQTLKKLVNENEWGV